MRIVSRCGSVHSSGQTRLFPDRLDKPEDVPSGLVGKQVWHLITGCHVCVGLICTSDNTGDLSQYDPHC